MIHTGRKRNTPIVTLLKNYSNKKSGKVTESRNEIQTRFDYLDWKDQKKIILAFLESGKTDRQWAYLKALDYWDKAFEPKIKELWEELHERKCSWVVTRHFPKEYLQRNIDQFSEGRDYYFICLRLAEDKDFVIQQEKLSPTDYLAVLYHTGRNIQDDEAHHTLLKTVRHICEKEPSIYDNLLDSYTHLDVGTIISPIRFRDVSRSLYYLKGLNCEHIVAQFTIWNDAIEKAIYSSQEYKSICQSRFEPFDYPEAAISLCRKYASKALEGLHEQLSTPSTATVLPPEERPAEASIPTPADPAVLKAMMAKNPTLERLINDFELDTEESLLPF